MLLSIKLPNTNFVWTITGNVKSIVCLANKFSQLYTDLTIRSRSKLLKMTRNNNGRLRIFNKITVVRVKVPTYV